MVELYTPVTWSSIHPAISTTAVQPTSNIYVPSVITPSYRQQYIQENYPTLSVIGAPQPSPLLGAGYQQATGALSPITTSFYTGASSISEQIRRGIPIVSERVLLVPVVGPALAYVTPYTSESVARGIETVGMIPGGLEVIARRPQVFPTALQYGVGETISSLSEEITTRPGQVVSDILVSGLFFKGLGTLPRPKISFRPGRLFGETRAIREYRTMLRESPKPFLKAVDIASYNRMVAENIKSVSRPSTFGKMFGASRIPPTLEVRKSPTTELHNLVTGERTVFMKQGAAYLVGRGTPVYEPRTTGFIKRGLGVEEYNKMVAERMKPLKTIELGRGATITGRSVNVMEYLMVGGQRITPSFRPKVGGFRPKLPSAKISRLATQRLRGRPGRSMFRFGEGRFLPIIIPRVRGGQLSLPSEAISTRAAVELGERTTPQFLQRRRQIYTPASAQKQEKAILTAQFQVSQQVQRQMQKQIQRQRLGESTRSRFAPPTFRLQKPKKPRPIRGLPESDYGRKGGLLGFGRFGELARIKSGREILRGL